MKRLLVDGGVDAKRSDFLPQSGLKLPCFFYVHCDYLKFLWKQPVVGFKMLVFRGVPSYA